MLFRTCSAVEEEEDAGGVTEEDGPPPFTLLLVGLGSEEEEGGKRPSVVVEGEEGPPPPEMEGLDEKRKKILNCEFRKISVHAACRKGQINGQINRRKVYNVM